MQYVQQQGFLLIYVRQEAVHNIVRHARGQIYILFIMFLILNMTIGTR